MPQLRIHSRTKVLHEIACLIFMLCLPSFSHILTPPFGIIILVLFITRSLNCFKHSTPYIQDSR